VVCEFPDVFPEELTELPPDRDVKFVIELMPGAGPVAKSPYQMSPEELDELKKQLKKLLEQGFVWPSASLWGLSGILPGHSCKEGRRRTPTRIPL
jgi:hypothetical protein